ncbi:C40 family peptidase [Egicoccus sp. AB-alg6-2]|uniref:C40 family peptidase n=1 Tax=Egicoccus sp. AB-alg6-2 TaxID=3242692 RepID=UPI00359DF226
MRASLFSTAALLLVTVLVLGVQAGDGASASDHEPPDVSGVAASVSEREARSAPTFGVTRLANPARSVVTDADGAWLATFTDGARTAAVAGQERTFDEPGAEHAVTTDVWVRLLAEPFDGVVDKAWLEAAVEDRAPDVLEVGTQYLDDAPDVHDADGALVSGAAEYGPLQPDGSRPVGADWHDFLGVDADYAGRIDPADPEEYRALDCSGYVRIVFGHRMGLPMTLRPDGGASLPRRSFEQAASAPGVVPIADGDAEGAVADDALQAGDLVFFDSPNDRDGRIDHVGIYVGLDDGGHHRFLHSRRSANGPTLGGDDQGASVLDGDGYFAQGFTLTRRL